MKLTNGTLTKIYSKGIDKDIIQKKATTPKELIRAQDLRELVNNPISFQQDIETIIDFIFIAAIHWNKTEIKIDNIYSGLQYKLEDMGYIVTPYGAGAIISWKEERESYNKLHSKIKLLDE